MLIVLAVASSVLCYVARRFGPEISTHQTLPVILRLHCALCTEQSEQHRARRNSQGPRSTAPGPLAEDCDKMDLKLWHATERSRGSVPSTRPRSLRGTPLMFILTPRHGHWPTYYAAIGLCRMGQDPTEMGPSGFSTMIQCQSLNPSTRFNQCKSSRAAGCYFSLQILSHSVIFQTCLSWLKSQFKRLSKLHHCKFYVNVQRIRDSARPPDSVLFWHPAFEIAFIAPLHAEYILPMVYSILPLGRQVASRAGGVVAGLP